MEIYQEISKQFRRLYARKDSQRLRVIDTSNIFWQQIASGLSDAKVLDASILLNSVSDVCRYTYNYERIVDYANISPLHNSTWVELTDYETYTNLAAFILYQDTNGESFLINEAKERGIGREFKWKCLTRCFMKRGYGKTVPFKWEWIEYIDESGQSVGSLMQPISLPSGISQNANEDFELTNLNHQDLCALVANLGLFTIDMINNKLASLSDHSSTGFHSPIVSKGNKFEYQVVQLH
ncbi:hypothetical protein [Dendrosporobacter sp. 1207_IL3150]|uniref:hypothetical protein n=1 Tax=Dendrosporobacter sp. 1207_IL3150 TaxID=3084054 RepID=UPI002FD9D167